jgi:hypothetical protein
MPRSCACRSRPPASCGFVANRTSSGTPASSRRSSSAAQSAGRYRARPISACPAGGRVREGHRDLAQGNAADGAAVLAGRPGASVGGLLVGGLVHDQHHVAAVLVLACGKMIDNPVRGGAQHQLLIDPGAGQQVLHPVRARVPGGLAHRPAVVILQLAQQAVHHVTAGQAGLPPGEARSDPRHQVIEQARMPVRVYRGSSGCRAIVVFHKLA